MHINDYPDFIKKYDIFIGLDYNSQTQNFRFGACTVFDILGDGNDDSYHLIEIDRQIEILDMKNINYHVYKVLDELEEKINKLVESDQVITAPN